MVPPLTQLEVLHLSHSWTYYPPSLLQLVILPPSQSWRYNPPLTQLNTPLTQLDVLLFFPHSWAHHPFHTTGRTPPPFTQLEALPLLNAAGRTTRWTFYPYLTAGRTAPLTVRHSLTQVDALLLSYSWMCAAHSSQLIFSSTSPYHTIIIIPNLTTSHSCAGFFPISHPLADYPCWLSLPPVPLMPPILNVTLSFGFMHSPALPQGATPLPHEHLRCPATLQHPLSYYLL